MLEKTELEKVKLANDILLTIGDVSTQDRIDVLQIALDSMLAKKQMNNPIERPQEERPEDETDLWYIQSQSTVDRLYRVSRTRTGIFSCTCPNFQYRGNRCKHIQKVKMLLAGGKQKNKLVMEDG
jgi:hypothetical protein